jgi:hypothetical protein
MENKLIDIIFSFDYGSLQREISNIDDTNIDDYYDDDILDNIQKILVMKSNLIRKITIPVYVKKKKEIVRNENKVCLKV